MAEPTICHVNAVPTSPNPNADVARGAAANTTAVIPRKHTAIGTALTATVVNSATAMSAPPHAAPGPGPEREADGEDDDARDGHQQPADEP